MKKLEPGRAVRIALLANIIGLWATLMTVIGADILLTEKSSDILQNNRKYPGYIIFLILLSIILSTFTISYFFFAITANLFMVWGSVRKYNRLPIIAVFASLPLCWAVIYLQWYLLPDISWYTDHPDDPTPYDQPYGVPLLITRLTLLYFPSLIFSWWCVNRFASR